MNRSKQKGDRAERAIVELLRAHGLDAYRIPLSGAVAGFLSDVEIRLGAQVLKLESKCRSEGFTRIYKWLVGNDALVIRADREKPLAVIPLERLAQLLAQIPHNPIEKATDKPSLEPIAQPTRQEPQQVPNAIDPNIVLLHDDKVYLNKARLEPLRIASERYQDTVSRETSGAMEEKSSS